MATSGVISTNTKYGSCFWVKWEISGSQSIAGNKTTIAWSCGLTPGEQYYTNAIKMSAVSIAGVKVYDGGTYSDITDYKDRTFASGTLELSHNADGTKSFTVAAFSGWLFGNGDYTAAAKSFTLPTIPRATTPSIGPVTIGGKATISLPRASTAFTHTLSYSFGSASGTIATDSLGNTATYEATIPTEKVAFHLKAGGDGAAFGKAAEKSKALELAADWNLHAGRFIYMGGSKATNAEKDIYFQTMDGAANPHNTAIYGGNGESAAAWGVYDAQNKRSVIRYDDEAGTLRLLGFTPAGITISASGSYLKNFSGTAKHISALSMGILRVYGETNVAMPAGTTYDVASIGDHLPTSAYALSAYCLKNLDARLGSAGTIQIRPKEDIPAGYGIYIAGIWIAS